MNIQQLEYLIAVDKYKHFGKAAQACFITQPTLSAMIQKLEDELDVKIFDRTSHPIRTTDAGEELIDQAKKIVDDVMALRCKANALNNMVSGKVNLGIIPTVSGYLLPNQIFDFLQKHDKIELSVRELTTENLIKSLKSGELDAAIISTPFSNVGDFFSDFLFHEELMIYSTAEMKMGESGRINSDDIDPQKIWLLEEGNCLRTQFEYICNMKDNRAQPSNLDFKASSINTLVQLFDKIDAVTLMPKLASLQLPDTKKKNIYRFENPVPVRDISIIYYKPTYKQKLIDEMVRFIRESVLEQMSDKSSQEPFVSIKPQ